MQWIQFLLPLASAPNAEYGGIKRLAGAEACISFICTNIRTATERDFILLVLLKPKAPGKGIFL